MNFASLEEQIALLGEFVTEELGEQASVALYSDGGVMVETEVTVDRSGRGFAFDSLEELIDTIGEYKRD